MRTGFGVKCAAAGEKFDLSRCDLMMPEMFGMDLDRERMASPRIKQPG